MCLVERHLKALKGFSRQRAHLEGSMVEEYMLYQSNIYFSGYLHQIEGDMDVAPLGCKFHQQIEKRGVVGERYMDKSER